MLYGNPQIEWVSDETDIVGLRTLVLALDWALPRWPMTVAEIDAAAPGIPQVGGGLMLVGRRTRQRGGAMNTAWVYTGINGSGKDVTFKARGQSIDFRFEPGFAQVDIGLHPRIQQLLDDYQGQAIDGEIYFPPTITGPGGKKVKNPMGLVKDWLRMEGTFSYRYVSFTLAGAQEQEGHIVSSAALPGTTPRVAAGRDWLVAPTIWQHRGPVFEIVEQFWLSGPGGWPEPVYRNTGSEGGRERGLPLSGGDTLGRSFSFSDTQAPSERSATPL